MSWRCPHCGIVNEDSASQCLRPTCKGEKPHLTSSENVDDETKLQRIINRRHDRQRKGFLLYFVIGFSIVFFFGLVVVLFYCLHADSFSWTWVLTAFLVASFSGLMSSLFGEEFIDLIWWLAEWLRWL
jgi:hypothetical protein